MTDDKAVERAMKRHAFRAYPNRWWYGHTDRYEHFAEGWRARGIYEKRRAKAKKRSKGK